MRAHDLLRIRGSLRVVHIPAEHICGCECLPPDVVDALLRAGKCRASCLHENLVVDTGLEIIRAMLGGGFGFPTTGAFGVQDVSDLRISSMRFGNSLAPPAPVVGDTDISVSPATYTSTSVTVYYPTNDSITIVGVIPEAVTSLNGVGISEEGMFAANGAMLARVTFSPEVKLPTHALQFEHTITIGRP